MLSFTQPTPQDIADLVADLREADLLECVALGTDDIAASLAEGVRISAWSYAARVDGQMACIFGVHPASGGLLSDVGVPWMLGTDIVLAQRRAFMRLAPAYIRRMLAVYPSLVNIVHARNTKACAWLRRAGFTLGEPQPYGPHGEPFRLFTKDR